MDWYLYILECVDGSLYTGITTNIQRRLKEHNNKTGAKSLKGKLPVKLIFQETYINRSQASKREYEIKSLTRLKKMKLISTTVY